MDRRARKAHDHVDDGAKVRGVANPSPDDRYTPRVHSLDETDTEHRYFSACMASNTWNPGNDGLAAEHFAEEPGMYKFFQQYAFQSGGCTPPLSLVKQTYPSFEHLPGVDRRWLANRLVMLQDRRLLAASLRDAAQQLEDENVDSASEAMRAGLRSMRSNGHGVEIQEYVPPPTDQVVLPSLYEPLARAGGLHRGSYSLLVARTNVGKSWRAMQHAVDLALGGHHVVLFSMEMDMQMTMYRLHMLLHGSHSHAWDWQRRAAAAADRLAASGGRLEIEMPTHIGS